jgi:hypothetical protein
VVVTGSSGSTWRRKLSGEKGVGLEEGREIIMDGWSMRKRIRKER